MFYMKKYHFWLDQDTLDSNLKDTLLSLDPDEIREAFYTDLSFGTGGLRGLMGPGTNRVNLYTIRRATDGFAQYLVEQKLMDGVAIAYDNRKDSNTFAYEAAKVLATRGIKSYIFKALRPTPMLSYAVRYFKASGGIMITASHNPKTYNGFKAYNATGAQLNLDEAEMVISKINAIENPFGIPTLENDLIHWIDEQLEKDYLAEVEKISIHNLNKTVKIVYSPLHGTGGTVIPGLLRKHGYDVYPYEPHMIIDPDFSNTDSSNPEESAAYTRCIAYAKTMDADIIMVTDPDGDRLGIAVLHEGTYHLLTGNQTAAIELYYILSEKKKKEMLPKNGYVFTTNVTTELIEVIASSFDQKVITTLTGFKFIGEQAEKIKDYGVYVFGCEESYGSLIADFVRDKDAVQAVFLLAEIANQVKQEKKTLVDYLSVIYQTYGYYYEYTENIMLEGSVGLAMIQAVMDHFRSSPPKLKSLELLSYDDFAYQIHIENRTETPLDLPASNVLKFYYHDHTWIVFRPSGTEPKLKIYYGTRQKSIDEARKFVQNLNQTIRDEIDQILKGESHAYQT